MNKPMAVCFQVIFFFLLLMPVSTGMANQSLRGVLERSWQRYVDACRSGEEARVKEAISAYNYAATKNKYPMFGGPIPADTVKGLVAYAPDPNEVTYVKTLENGRTAALIYVRDSVHKEPAQPPRIDFLVMKFVDEEQIWKFDGLLTVTTPKQEADGQAAAFKTFYLIKGFEIDGQIRTPPELLDGKPPPRPVHAPKQPVSQEIAQPAINHMAATPTMPVMISSGAGYSMSDPPRVQRIPSMPVMEGMRWSDEAKEIRSCEMSNRAILSLREAAESVIRLVANARAPTARVADTYYETQIANVMRDYQSQGGTATSPDQVRVPDDPCGAPREAWRRKNETMQLDYDKCVAAHPVEVKLSSLSKQIVSARDELAIAEKTEDERINNPNIPADLRGKFDWAASIKARTMSLRTELAATFQQYRSAGGSAKRVEDVTKIPNPCAPSVGIPSEPSSISESRTMRGP